MQHILTDGDPLWENKIFIILSCAIIMPTCYLDLELAKHNWQSRPIGMYVIYNVGV